MSHRLLTRETLGVVLVLALLSVLANGYLFGVSDHAESLPQVKRILDRSYLQYDWLTNSNSASNGRLVFSLVMAGFSSVFGLEGACCVVYIATLCLLCVAAFLFTAYIWGEPGAGLIAVLLVLCNRLGSLGSSQLLTNMLIPAFLAYSMLLLAAYWLNRGHYLRSIVLITFASLIHPQIGVVAGMLLGLTRLVSLPRPERLGGLRKLSLLFVVMGTIAAMGLLAQRGSGGHVVNQVEVVRVLAWMRAPWHFVPFAWDRTVWINFLAFGVLVAVARASVPRSAFLDWLILGVLGLCVLGTLTFFWAPLLPLVYLQPFRMTVLVQGAGALYLAQYVWSRLRSSDPSACFVGLVLLGSLVFMPKLATVLPVQVAAAVVLAEILREVLRRVVLPARVSRFGSVLNWLASAPVAWLAIAIAMALIRLPWRTDYVYPLAVVSSLGVIGLEVRAIASRFLHRTVMATSALVGLAMVALLGARWVAAPLPAWLAPLTANVKTHLVLEDDFSRLALWVRANTPPDAMFIVPPYTESFRLIAERAIVVDFKTFAARGYDILEWRNRITDLSGGRSLSLGYAWYLQLKETYHGLSTEQFLRLAEKYGAGYAVAETTQLALPLVYQNPTYVVYELKPFSLLGCRDELDTAVNTMHMARFLTLLEVGCFAHYESYPLPFRWEGPEIVSMQDLPATAPPLSVTGNRGDFIFRHISTETGDVIRVSPVLNGASGNEKIIQFGPWLEDKGHGLKIQGDSFAQSESLEICPGQVVLLSLWARLSAPSTETTLFIEDYAETWELSHIRVAGTAWQQYVVAKKIRSHATSVVMGIGWEPIIEQEWLEIRDMRVFVAPPEPGSPLCS